MNPVILRRFIKRAHPRLKAEARNFGSKLETQSSKLEDQKSSLGSARSKLEIAKLEELEARKYLARCNPSNYTIPKCRNFLRQMEHWYPMTTLGTNTAPDDKLDFEVELFSR